MLVGLTKTMCAAAVLTLAVACGGSPKPAGQLTQTQASIRAAEEVGAQQSPQAALYLKMARDAFSEAEAMIARDENGQARLALQRSEADAELALALAKHAQQKKEAEQLLDKLRRLEEEMN